MTEQHPSREAIAKVIEPYTFGTGIGTSLAAADAILEAFHAPVWRDMDSAPKDGTQFMSMQDDWGPFVTWRDDARNYPWRFLDRDNEINGFRDGKHGPTRWAPLQHPEHPAVQPDKQQIVDVLLAAPKQDVLELAMGFVNKHPSPEIVGTVFSALYIRFWDEEQSDKAPAVQPEQGVSDD